MKEFSLKRIYEPHDQEDGHRVLIDRLWPRGVSKEVAQLDDWAKIIAPSTELRKWFGHDPHKFEEFEAKYLAELRAADDKINKMHELCELAMSKKVTLLFAAKDPVHNHSIILKEELERLRK